MSSHSVSLARADLRTYLLSVPAIAALVGTRVYSALLPQPCDDPSVLITLISLQVEHAHDSVDEWAECRLQIDLFGDGLATVESLRDEIVDALHMIDSEQRGNTRFGAFFLESENDDYDFQPRRLKRSLDYRTAFTITT